MEITSYLNIDVTLPMAFYSFSFLVGLMMTWYGFKKNLNKDRDAR